MVLVSVDAIGETSTKCLSNIDRSSADAAHYKRHLVWRTRYRPIRKLAFPVLSNTVLLHVWYGVTVNKSKPNRRW